MGVALVTGTSSGFGLLTALELARRGDTVVATMRHLGRSGALEAAARYAGLTLELEQLDVTDRASVDACVERVLERHGRIDALVNNAGTGDIGPLEAYEDDEVLQTFDTNVFGTLRTIRAVLPTMRTQRAGVVVNVTSMAGFIAPPFMGLYAATKFALEALSESLHGEVLPFGVRVVTVQPAAYDTPMAAVIDAAPAGYDVERSPYAEPCETVRVRHLRSMKKRTTPEEVAVAVAEAVADPDTPPQVVVPASEQATKDAARSIDPLDFRAMVRASYGI